LAVFACTSKVTSIYEDDDDFVEKYQRAFRIMVFETERGEMMRGYVERVAFAPLELEGRRQGAIGFLNDKPKWENGDNAPATVAGSPAMFLFQLFAEIAFPTVEGAPPQMEIGFDDEPEPVVEEGLYRLFLQNNVYFFGGTTPDSAVYVITQKL